MLADELGRERAEALGRDSVDFPFPITRIGDGASVLELFHGPTLAFKDIGARFMAGAMTACRPPDAPGHTVLVATSGDTGGAVAQAFRGREGVRVVILFPEGRVSPRQRAQLILRRTRRSGGFCARGVRRLSADGQRSVFRHLPAGVLRPHFRQFDQCGPPASPDLLLLLWCPVLGGYGPAPGRFRAFGESGQPHGGTFGQSTGGSDRPTRGRYECKPDPDGLPTFGTVYSAALTPDGFQRDGRRRSEQHGAHSESLPDSGCGPRGIRGQRVVGRGDHRLHRPHLADRRCGTGSPTPR